MFLKRTISMVLLVTIVFFLWMGQEQRRFIDSGAVEMASLPHVGHLAPDFTLETLKSPKEAIQLSALNESATGTIIYFWTSWCPFCASSMEALQLAYSEHGEDINFLGVNVTNQDTVPAAERFIEEHGVEFLNVSDSTGRVASNYFVPPVPATLFIDDQGYIVHRKVGGLTRQELEQGIRQIGRGS